MSNELIKAPNRVVISQKVLDVVGGQEVWDKLCIEYREKMLRYSGTKLKGKPQLVPIFKKCGLGQHIYNKVLGLIGDNALLHEALNRITQLEVNTMAALVNELTDELRKRIPKMDDKNLIELAKQLPLILGDHRISPAVQITQQFDIDRHLAQRGIDDLDYEEVEEEQNNQ